MNSRLLFFLFLSFLCVSSGCSDGMRDEAKLKPYEKSDFFQDGRSARPLVEGTVARGHLYEDSLLYTGRVGDEFSPLFPFEVNDAVLQRGRNRYNIYCIVCHDALGTGRGMVVARGFPRPPDFHTDRLRDAPAGYLFDVITRGQGNMPSYAGRINAQDRWAIIAYLRALQRSQHTNVTELNTEERKQLQGDIS